METGILSIEQKKAKSYCVAPNGVMKAAIKDVSTSSRIVTGFYNTFNFIDSSNDVLLPGCATKSIKEHGTDAPDTTFKIKHCLQHDMGKMPGKIITLQEKTIDGVTGIYFETKMANTTLGNDTLQNYLEKIYDNHSIGFRYVSMKMIEKESHGNSQQWANIYDQLLNPKEADAAGYLFAVSEIKLYEGSTVGVGCNTLTPFLGVKSGNPESYKLAIQNKISILCKALKDGRQSDEMMLNFEVYELQLKQLFAEITDLIPFTKGTPETEPPRTFEQILYGI